MSSTILVIIILLTVMLVVISWIAFAQHSRCNKLEKITNNVIVNMLSIQKVISETSKVLNDKKFAVAFSNDDDVGKFFNEIREIQSILDRFVVKSKDGKESV